ncbi:MAG: hypothetical protein HY985_01250 [Magnetospirillum sp.]|nr:hypothetical protein [Magnetospirillum sp.]
MNGRLKNLASSTLIVLVVTALTLLAGEFAIRWLMPQLDPSGQLEFVGVDGGRFLTGRPGAVQRQVKNTGDFDVTIRFDAHGFRESKDIAAAAADDWFVMGDSLPFGWGVDEAERVGNRLEAPLGAHVFTLAIPTSPPMWPATLAYAEAKGAPIRNLLIVFSTEARLADYERLATATPPNSASFAFLKGKVWLMSHSALYFLVTSAIHRLPAVKTKAIAWGLINPAHEGFPGRAHVPTAAASTTRLLKALSAPYARVAVAVAPSRGLWVGEHRADEDRMHRDFLAALAAAGLPVVDLRPAFEAGGNPLQWFFRHDGHWNSAGHRIAAETIAAALPAKGSAR